MLCSCNTEQEPITSEESDITEFYREFIQAPTYSFINHVKSRNNSNGTNTGIPCLTETDIQFLLSMNEVEFKDYISNLKSNFVHNAEETIDSVSVSNLQFAYDKLGGNNGLDKIQLFSESYINSLGGEDILKQLVPNGLNESQLKIYAMSAVLIDNVIRPYYEALIDQNISISRSTKSICDFEAGAKLALAGVAFGAEQIFDTATAGAGFSVEGLEVLVLECEIARIRAEYEICMGRWH